MKSKKSRTKTKKPKISVTSTSEKAESATKLQRREINGYIAVSHGEGQHGSLGWIYLRKQSDNKLFIGNLPWPMWLPFNESTKTLSESDEMKLKTQLTKLIPQAINVSDVFPMGNGRLATRIELSNEQIIENILSKPEDHIYLNARDELVHSNNNNRTIHKWIEQYEHERDVTKVQNWSDATMQAFEQREKKANQLKEKRARAAAIPDDDGFVTVTNGAPQMKAGQLAKSGGPLSIGVGTSSSKNCNGRDVGKRKGGKRQKDNLQLRVAKGIEKNGFYRWQRRNENALGQLQTKFRDDQKRVAALRGLDKQE